MIEKKDGVKDRESGKARQRESERERRQREKTKQRQRKVAQRLYPKDKLIKLSVLNKR